MIIEKNVNLSKKTTFRVGGIAKKFFIPENCDELINLLHKLKKEDFKIISGGSNILINDNKTFQNVISMEKIDTNIENNRDGSFYVGCSNKIQQVIKKLNQDGYGGFEELFGLPALFGGIIYMNAGIGSCENQLFSISEFIQDVKVIDIDSKKIKYINKDECNFSYRNSLFHNNKYIILGANIKAKKQEASISSKRINERIKYCREHQEWGKGCFGTCFSKCNRKILKMMSFFNKKNNGIYQSKNNSNWLVNGGSGTFDEAMKIISKAKKIHSFFRQKIEIEVIIWD